MKSKLYFLLVLCTVLFSAYNFVLSVKMEGNVIDVTLNGLESSASSDESGWHGRPLLRDTKTNAFYCSNCTGSDCGAAC